MKKGYIYIVLSAFLFSTIEITTKLITTSVNPIQLLFLRFIIGGFIFLPFALYDIKKQDIKFHKKDLLFFLYTGFLNIVVSMSFFQMAIVYTKASTVAVLFSTNPVYTILFASLILKEKINKNTIIACIFSLLGIVFILNPLNLNPDIKGISLTILASITFSLYSVASKPGLSKYGSLIMNCFTFIIGDILLLVLMLIFKVPIIKGINSSNIISILYLGIFATALGYLLYFMAMKETSAIISSMLFFIKPALAPILAFIILKEHIPLNTIIGIVCILLGSYVNFSKRGINSNIPIKE